MEKEKNVRLYLQIIYVRGISHDILKLKILIKYIIIYFLISNILIKVILIKNKIYIHRIFLKTVLWKITRTNEGEKESQTLLSNNLFMWTCPVILEKQTFCRFLKLIMDQ